MSRGNAAAASTAAAVGAEDFLARFAPNLSRKERGSLTSMVRHAVRDYMEENRLAQPPPHRLLAAFEAQRQRRRPTTALGDFRRAAAASALGDDDGEDNFCLVGSSTGIPTDTPRYAMVSPRFAPPPAPSTATSAAAAEVACEDRRHGFPATLMGFVRRDGETDVTSTEQQQPQEQELVKEEAPAAAPAAAAGGKPAATSKQRPATAGNWLTWRGATPFCANDRELRAFRHQQNPRKPQPEELPHLALYRPRTARGLPTSAAQRQPAAGSERSPIDRGLMDWIQGANEHDKRVAYNLVRAMDSGRTDGLEAFSRETVAAAPRPDRLWRSHTKPEEQHTFGRRTRPQTPRTMRRTLAEVEQPKVPFSGVEADYGAARSGLHPLRPMVDYVHPGSGFSNASPPYRGNFAVHPDWVSEQLPQVPAVRRSRPPGTTQ